MARILLVQNDETSGYTIRQTLTREFHIVDFCRMGSEANERVRTIDFDLLILDWVLPDTTGLEICTTYRESGGLATILFLTAHSSLREKTLGFNGGADDYLTKPFHVKELILRVNALLKRPRRSFDNMLKAGDIGVDWLRHKAFKSGQEVHLSGTEFQVLEFLMRNQNQCFSQESILSKIWPMESEVTTQAVKTTIKRLRRKLDPQQNVLRTVRGVGYVLDTQSVKRAS